MPRKASLEPKTSTVKVKRSNGDIYVYERTTRYNPEKRYNETIDNKLIGKILAGTTEIVETRPRKKVASEEVVATRKRVGVTEILEWIGRESGIDQDLYRSTDKGTAEKILSIARYWTANPGKTIPYIEEWQINHALPYKEGISLDSCYTLLKEIGFDESLRQKFFSYRASSCPSCSAVAFDSTTVSSYSDNQIEARSGYDKSGDGLKTIKLLTLYSVNTAQPVAYSRQPGNIPDITSVVNAAIQLSDLGMDKPLLVMDAGFYSEENMGYLIDNHIKFLMNGKVGVSWVKKELETALPDIKKLSFNCPFDSAIYGTSITINHGFSRELRKKCITGDRGDVITDNHKLYIHMFLNIEKRDAEVANLASDIRSVENRIKSGVALLSDAEKKLADKYLIIKNTRSGISITYNEKNFSEAKLYSGCMVLISNKPMGTFEALHLYRRREKIEEFFRLDKQVFDGNRPRVWYPESLNGRFFCQFIALCYTEFLKKQIHETKKTLAVKNGDPEHDKQQNLKDEKALLNWLDQISIERLFAWFDCIEGTNVNNALGKRRWKTETVKRDKLFLRKLGVISS